jgi:hypothetical protein
MALFGHGAMFARSPLSGVKPTWAGRRGMSACDPYRKVDRSSAKILDQGSNPEHQKNNEKNPRDAHPAHHSERHIINHVVHRELASQFGDSSDSTFDRIEGSSPMLVRLH